MEPRMSRNPLLMLAILLAAPLAQAAPGPQAQREIAQLIGSLDGSQCRFQRNGSWYDGSDARAHLQRKYDYLLKKNQVDSAEQFIGSMVMWARKGTS